MCTVIRLKWNVVSLEDHLAAPIASADVVLLGKAVPSAHLPTNVDLWQVTGQHSS